MSPALRCLMRPRKEGVLAPEARASVGSRGGSLPLADASTPRAVALQPLTLALLALATALLAWRVAFPAFAWLPFSDRDLLRASELGAVPMVEGAEAGHGPRTPGGSLYALLWLAQQLGDAPVAVARLLRLGDAFAAVCVGLGARRLAGSLAGALAAFLYASMPALASTYSVLWNPGLVPPLAALAWLGLLRCLVHRDARWMPGVVLALAIAAQCHPSAWAVMLCLPAVLALVRPAGLPRALLLGLGLGVCAYLPWIVAQGWSEGAAWHTMLANPGGVASSPASLGPRLWGVLGYLNGPAPRGLAHPVAAVVRGLDVLLWLAVLRLGWKARHARTDSALALAVAGSLALLLAIPDLPWHRAGTGRYLVAVAPGAAVVGGVALGRWIEAVPWRGWPVLLVVGMGARGWAAWALDGAERSGPRAFHRLERRLDEVGRATGLSLPGIAARTVVFESDGEAWSWRADTPVAYLMASAGAEEDVLAAPPCLALWSGLRGDPPDLAPVLGEAVTSILDVVSLEGGDTLVRYVPEASSCLTSFAQPWVERDVDRVVARVGEPLRAGEAAALPWQDGRLVVARLAEEPSLLVGVALDEGRVTLWSRPLSGDTRGFLPEAHLDGVVLEGVGADGAPIDVPLAPGLVGPRGRVTPRAVAVPEGVAWRAMEATVLGGDGAAAGARVRVPLR